MGRANRIPCRRHWPRMPDLETSRGLPQGRIVGCCFRPHPVSGSLRQPGRPDPITGRGRGGLACAARKHDRVADFSDCPIIETRQEPAELATTWRLVTPESVSVAMSPYDLRDAVVEIDRCASSLGRSSAVLWNTRHGGRRIGTRPRCNVVGRHVAR